MVKPFHELFWESSPRLSELEFSERSQLVAEALYISEVLPSKRQTIGGHLHTMFAAALVTLTDEGSCLIPTRDLSTWSKDYGMTQQTLRYLDDLHLHGFIFCEEEKVKGIIRPTEKLAYIAAPLSPIQIIRI